MALADPGPPHEREPDLGGRAHLLEDALDQPLVAGLDDAGDDRRRPTVADRLGDRRLIDARRGLGADPVGGDQNVDVGGGAGLAQMIGRAAPARKHHAAVVQRAAQVDRAPAVAPGADQPEENHELTRARLPQDVRGSQRKRREREQIEDQPHGDCAPGRGAGCRQRPRRGDEVLVRGASMPCPSTAARRDRAVKSRKPPRSRRPVWRQPEDNLALALMAMLA